MEGESIKTWNMFYKYMAFIKDIYNLKSKYNKNKKELYIFEINNLMDKYNLNK